MSEPLILTLTLDDDSFAFFDELRRRHFPPERNYLDAHLTLFHKLPGEEIGAIERDLERVARHQPAIELAVTGVRFYGFGGGFTLESAALKALRAKLRDRWEPWLSAQDRREHSPHVTYQNKAPAELAKKTFARMEAQFEPFTARGTGLALWRYLGGPWDLEAEFTFCGARGPAASTPADR